MRLNRETVVAIALLILSTSLARADSYKEISARVEAAKAAIDGGKVVPGRDLAPLIDMLRKSHDDDDQRHLVDAIVDLGSADGSSPSAVKRYILEETTPVLASIAENRSNSNFLRGDALTGLRKLGAPRPVLQKVADMASKDADEYVKSRGEILENFIRSMPAESRVSVVTSTDPAKERNAIAFLKSHDLGVSLEQLNRSAGEGKAEEVAALLAAGVDANGGPAGQTPLDSAILGCGQGGENGGIVKTVETLIAAGANVKRKGDNDNTPLLSAAQYCGAGVVQRLIAAGANVNAINASGTTPLMIAFFTKHLDAAETLVAKGATLTPQQATAVSAMATDAQSKAIIQKATRKKSSK
jgi:hypothetical protein